MIDRPLDSDTLGEKGEKRFGEICADARLIANTANRDRAGWDYTVDFPHEIGSTGLDSRPAPISARVQVKTQWSDRTDVKLRLSSAERLVKHGGPSFLCVLCVDPDLQFSSMRIIHCRGEIVARVLKRLRKAEARGERPNDVWLRIDPSKYADAAPVTHSALLAALNAVCTTDHVAYLTAKDAELKSLGFERNALQLNVGIFGSEDEILDGFLGLSPLNVGSLAAIETRFGISLPSSEFPPGPAKLSFLHKYDPAVVKFRVADKVYRFRGDVRRLPGPVTAALGRLKLIVETDLHRISFIADMQGATPKLSLALGCNPKVLDDTLLKAHQWRDLYAILAATAGGGVELKITRPGTSSVTEWICDPAAKSGPQWRKLARLTSAAALVFDRVGAPNAKITLQDLWTAGDDIVSLAAMLRDSSTVTGASFTTDTEIDLPRSEPAPLLFGYGFKVGRHTIAYGARMDMTGVEAEGEVAWSSSSLTFLGLHRPKSERDYYAFLESLPQEPYRVVTNPYQPGRTVISRRDAADGAQEQ